LAGAHCDHLGLPIASPAVIARIGNGFRRDVDSYATKHSIPILSKPDRTRWEDRKLDHVRPYLEAAQRAGRYGVVAIVAAQEFQWVLSAAKKSRGEAVWFDWNKCVRRVSCFYFYIHDRHFRGLLHQDLQLLPLASQGVVQRPRVGQTPSPTGPGPL
jgi:hypothetical protein